MKKSLIIYSLLGLTFLLSCEKDETRVVIKENITAPAITYPSDNYTKIISPADSADYFVIRWDAADYGVMTPVTYTIRLDSTGKELTGAYILAATTADSLALTFYELNALLLDDLGLPQNVESVLELQVSASINDLFPVSSEVITMKITPWRPKDYGTNQRR